MLVIALFIIGFFLAATSAAFGQQIIEGFEMTLYIYYFTSFFLVILTLIMILAGGAYGATGGKLGAILGALAGGTYSIMFIFVFAVQMYLIFFIIDNIDSSATSFTTIGEDAKYAIYGFIAMFIFSRMSSSD